MPPQKRNEFIDSLTESDVYTMIWAWKTFAREEQLAPEWDWRVWMIRAGRGFGKTRTGAEWIRKQVKLGKMRGAIVGRTAADVRDVMIEGESGILACCPPHDRPNYEPSKRRLTWANGAIVTAFTADEPDLLRGPQHEFAWCDELAAYRYLSELWDNLMLGLRLGANPQCVVTTTPRPRKLLKEIEKSKSTAVTTGSTYDNRPNLAKGFFDDIVSKYEGTTVGQQELWAEILEEMPGALWKRDWIDGLRVTEAADLSRIVVGVDPATTSKEDSDETGIVVCGRSFDDHGFTLDDKSGRMSPDEWARAAVRAYHEHKADRIVAEVNNGGDLVERMIRMVDPNVSYTAVHATKGKRVRAEPVAALCEQGRDHHVGVFPELEDQLCNWVQGESDESPDRLDAKVWAMTELFELAAPIVSVGVDNLSRRSQWDF